MLNTTLLPLAVFISVLAFDTDEFTSAEARKANRTYKNALQDLEKEYLAKRHEIRERYKQDLRAARKAALADDDLAEAQRILAVEKRLSKEPLKGMEEEPIKPARAPAQVVTVWKHFVNDRPSSITILFPDGRCMTHSDTGRWTLNEGVLILDWDSADERFIDRCHVPADGKTYVGRNQSQGVKISGELLGTFFVNRGRP